MLKIKWSEILTTQDQSVQKLSHKLTVRIKSISPHKPIQRSRSHLQALIILL